MEPPHLPGWNFCFATPVRFRDIDMFDHVNNAAYLTYAESARVAYYSQVTGLQDPHDFDMTVARVEIDFKKPIFFPATINVFTRASRIGTKSWTLEHELRDAANADLLATCTTVLVHFDHQTGQSKPISPEIISRIESHEGHSLTEAAPTKGSRSTPR
jgi:acyl-CoA thioester hydrolase